MTTATNPFLNHYNSEALQRLHSDLIVGAIKFAGINVYYVPRNIVNKDQLYGTDDQSTYTQAIQTIAYPENIDGFQGQKDLFTKFGLEINEQITMVMAKRTFEEDILPLMTNGASRPDEGDLIYFPFNQKCFQIKFTNNKEIFYAFGALPTYQMTCELFQYSAETFNTGVPEIDIIQKKFSLNVLDNTIQTDTGLILTTEDGDRITLEDFDVQNLIPDSDNDELVLAANGVVDNTTSVNPFGQINLKLGD